MKKIAFAFFIPRFARPVIVTKLNLRAIGQIYIPPGNSDITLKEFIQSLQRNISCKSPISDSDIFQILSIAQDGVNFLRPDTTHLTAPGSV